MDLFFMSNYDFKKYACKHKKNAMLQYTTHLMQCQNTIMVSQHE